MRQLIKPLIITGFIACLAAIAIMMLVVMTKDASYKQTQAQVDEILEIMSCPNNQCDRFKGKDAKALEDRLRKEIEKVRKDCGV